MTAWTLPGRLYKRAWPSVAGALAHALTLRSADYISPDLITIRVWPARGSKVPLTLEYRLSGPQTHDGKSLVFGVFNSPLRILSAVSSAGRFVRDSAASFRLRPTSRRWNGETVRVTAEWAPTPGAPILLIPGHLPKVMGRSLIETRPGIRIELIDSTEVTVGGLMRKNHQEFDVAGVFVEAVLVWAPEFQNRDFILTRPFASELGSSRSVFLDRASQVLQALRAVLGPAGVRFTWSSGRWAPRLPVSSGCWAPGSDVARSALNTAMQLASLWWEGGCRFVGRERLLLEEALRDYSVLCVAMTLMPETTERMVKAYAAVADQGAIAALGSWLTFDGVPRSRAARLGLAIFDASRSRPEVVETVRRVAGEGWGECVPAHAVLSRLLDVGVDPIRVRK